MGKPSAVPSWPYGAIHEACRAASIEPSQLVPLGVGHCACFAVPDARLFIRVGRPGTEELARNAVRIGRSCAGSLPMLAPAPVEVQQPLVTAGGPVTFWPLLEPTDDKVDFGWFGKTLRSLHEFPGAPDTQHRQNDPARGWSRLEKYRNSPNAHPTVAREIEQLLNDYHGLHGRVVPTLRRGFIHGDAYPANVLTTVSGSYLVDYDTAGFGARYWDLAPTVVAARRFDVSDDEAESLFTAYGEDPRSDARFWDVVRLREWGTITYLLERAGTSAVYHEELYRRLATRHQSCRWKTLSQLMDADDAID
ncbi:phosphotransferase family protein [Streptomyces sp. NPDC001127]|uniref:phosphotransferase family protein n=1 Tax=Streptomyces sp. NPDC001127 TaxID=3154377 RepID=UPI0033336CD8